MKENLFRKASLDKVTSPEQLDELIRVANPSLWVTLAAIVILLAAVLGWSVFGALPTTLSASAFSNDGTLTFYLSAEEAATVKGGMTVQTGASKGIVSSVGALPLSRDEAAATLGSDYLVGALILSDWSVPVTATVPGADDGLCEVRVTVDSVNPIHFILN